MAGYFSRRKKFIIRTLCDDGLGNETEHCTLFIGGSIGAQKRMNDIYSFLSADDSFSRVRVFLFEVTSVHRVGDIVNGQEVIF